MSKKYTGNLKNASPELLDKFRRKNKKFMALIAIQRGLRCGDWRDA